MKEEKDLLRKKYRLAAGVISPEDEISIASNILSVIQKTKPQVIGSYIPMPGEADISNLIEYQALPKIIDGKLQFVLESRKYLDKSEYFERSSIFPDLVEPKSNDLIKPDLILIPALAFDVKGYRLGRGKGYFDNYIARNPSVKTIGVCFSNNLLLSLPREAHDCRMQFIVTENFILVP